MKNEKTLISAIDIGTSKICALIASYDQNNIIEILDSIGITYDSKKSKVNIMLWGTGQVYREFLYVDDLASAILHIIKNVN